ncbi:MAG: TIGR02757 family protein [Denitrovibrio sp.]|nr:MAG: TIGR02757 family protein [Denitrovibrio sp.]
MKDFPYFFEEIYSIYNKKEYIHTDPIYYPHTLEGNKEFIAFTSACFAYGNVKAIKSFLTSFFNHYGSDPLRVKKESAGLYYRFQKKADVEYYADFMNRIYSEHGSIENIFNQRDTLEEGIDFFYETMHGMCSDAGNGFFFLIPNPKTSGAKRLRMFLRWMIRKDDVDFGLWDSFDPSQLMMPIDTHILRFAKNNNIIKNETASRANLTIVSNFFRALNAADPAKYDFALTRLGIVNSCKYRDCDYCVKCIHKKGCIFA